MEVNVERMDDDRVRLLVALDAAEVDKSIVSAYRDLASGLNVPGFRKGKVPKEVVNARVGRDVVLSEAQDTLVALSYRDALGQTKTRPIDRPTIDPGAFEEGKPFSYEAVVEVQPELPSFEYLGLEAEKPEFEITDEEIDEQLRVLQDRFATHEPVLGRPAQTSDHALITFTGVIDGEENPHASGQDFLVELGSNTLMPPFEERLLGSKPGDIKKFSIDFPAEHHEEAIASKTVGFTVIVKELKKKVHPTVDDAFAKEVGGFENLDELRDVVRGHIREVKERDAVQAWRSRILDTLMESISVDLPDKMIEHEMDVMMVEFAQVLARQGVSVEEYANATERSVADLRNSFREEAAKRAKTELVLETVADRAGVSVGEEDLATEIAGMAERLGKDPKDVAETLTERGEMHHLIRDILLRKAFFVVLEGAKVKGAPPETEQEESSASDEGDTESTDSQEGG